MRPLNKTLPSFIHPSLHRFICMFAYDTHFELSRVKVHPAGVAVVDGVAFRHQRQDVEDLATLARTMMHLKTHTQTPNCKNLIFIKHYLCIVLLVQMACWQTHVLINF